MARHRDADPDWWTAFVVDYFVDVEHLSEAQRKARRAVGVAAIRFMIAEARAREQKWRRQRDAILTGSNEQRQLQARRDADRIRRAADRLDPALSLRKKAAILAERFPDHGRESLRKILARKKK